MSKMIERDGKNFIQVGPNDSFGSIAYEHTGHSARWVELLKCNEGLDSNRPVVSGTMLTVPEAWLEAREAEAVQSEPSTLEASGDVARESVRTILKEVIGEWAAHADETIQGLKDQVALLEMKRDQDEKRLAEQGAKIITLEASVRALAGMTPPAVEDPNRTGASGGTG